MDGSNEERPIRFKKHARCSLRQKNIKKSSRTHTEKPAGCVEVCGHFPSFPILHLRRKGFFSQLVSRVEIGESFFTPSFDFHEISIKIKSRHMKRGLQPFALDQFAQRTTRITPSRTTCSQKFRYNYLCIAGFWQSAKIFHFRKKVSLIYFLTWMIIWYF